MLVCLKSATTGLLAQTLTGFITVAPFPTGAEIVYSVYLPCAEHPRPSSWESVEALTGVSADEVAATWDPDSDGRRNAGATDAFARLRGLVGSTFAARIFADVDSRETIALTRPTTEVLPPEAPQAPDPSGSPARVGIADITARWDVGGFAVRALDDAAEAAVIVVPSLRNPDPESWGIVECVSGVPGEAVRESWDDRDENPDAVEAVSKLAQALVDHNVTTAPVVAGKLDLSGLREELVRALPYRPYFFPNRDLIRSRGHIQAYVRARLNGMIFRAAVEADDGSPELVRIRLTRGRAELQRLRTDDHMRSVVAECVATSDWSPPTKRRPARVEPKYPPRELLRDMLVEQDERLPELERIVRIPSLRPDGTVLQERGYDAATRLWYAPDLDLEPIPDAPTDVQVANAFALVSGPYYQFPYARPADWAVAMACLLQSIVLPMIAGPRPMFVFEAPPKAQGTGKSLLARSIQAAVTGKNASTRLPTNEDEIEKRISMLVARGTPFVVFDNVTTAIASESLAILATETYWQGRRLQTSEPIVGPVPGVVVMTTNGAQVDRDSSRRVMISRLDTGRVDPFKGRGFEIEGDLIAFVKANRPHLVRSLVLLARAWVVAGMPRDKELEGAMGSYESWRDVVGGLVNWLGCRGLSDAVAEAQGRDSQTVALTDYLSEWLARFGVGPVRALALANLANDIGSAPFADVAKRVGDPWKARSAAEVLDRLAVGGVFAIAGVPHRVIRLGSLQDGRAAYQLEAVN